VDYHDPDLSASIRELAPGGVDAVFDHLGGASFRRSFDLLARGGTLLGYGMAAQITDTGSVLVPFLRVYAKLAIWSALPNGRRAMFFNLWGGSRRRGDVAESPARTRGTTSPGPLARGPLALFRLRAAVGLAGLGSQSVRGPHPPCVSHELCQAVGIHPGQPQQH
jgi:Zinc-binding dehydrogenase